MSYTADTYNEQINSGRLDSRNLLDRLKTLGIADWHAADMQDVDPDDVDEANAIIDALTVLYDSSADTCEDGIMAVIESEWEDYAREYADDIGAIPTEASWPAMHIDWKAAAQSLAMDYALVSMGGKEWYVR